MSLYTLQKLIREINRNADLRSRFMSDANSVAAEWKLSEPEHKPLVSRDYTALYQMKVHGLLLRPFSILHQVSEPDYLDLIRRDVE